MFGHPVDEAVNNINIGKRYLLLVFPDLRQLATT